MIVVGVARWETFPILRSEPRSDSGQAEVTGSAVALGAAIIS